jgi:hypothetical protein
LDRLGSFSLTPSKAVQRHQTRWYSEDGHDIMTISMSELLAEPLKK